MLKHRVPRIRRTLELAPIETFTNQVAYTGDHAMLNRKSGLALIG